jgi:hypothetical protein
MPDWVLYLLVFAVGVLVGAALAHFNKEES